MLCPRKVNCLGLTPLFVIFGTISGCGSAAVTTANGSINRNTPAVFNDEASPRSSSKSPDPGKTNHALTTKRETASPTAAESTTLEVQSASTLLPTKRSTTSNSILNPMHPLTVRYLRQKLKLSLVGRFAFAAIFFQQRKNVGSSNLSWYATTRNVVLDLVPHFTIAFS